MKKNLNVIICYNNADEVCKYIEKLNNRDDIRSLEIALVVNSASDADRRVLETITYAYVHIYYAEKNLGYLNGLAWGFMQYVSQHEEPKWVVMSNTDLIYSKDFFSHLDCDSFDRQVGCIGPSVYAKYCDSYDNPVCDVRRSIKQINRYIRIFSNPVVGPLYDWGSSIKRQYIRKKEPESHYTYEVHGCCFILSAEIASIISQNRYGAFMYSEETFIAEEVLKNGKCTYYDKSLRVEHLEHSVTKLLGHKKIAKYIAESMEYIKDQFY